MRLQWQTAAEQTPAIGHFNWGGSDLSTYKTYKLYLQAQRSSTGAQTVTIAYSTDGSTFTNFGTTMSPGNGSFTEQVFDLSTITSLDNKSSVYFKIMASGASGSGTLRIDNFEISAISTSGSGGIQNLTQVLETGNDAGGLNAVNFGKIGIGVTSPSQKLEVAGTIFSNTGGFKFPDGTVQTSAVTGGGTSSQWITSGSNISFSSGNVGIGTGTTTPTEKLQVSGNIKSTGTITATGMNITGGSTASVFDSIHVLKRIKIGNSIVIDQPNNNIYTDATVPTDFLIQSNSLFNNNTIINANNTGHVQIGDAPYQNGSPSSLTKLEVRGSVSIYDGNGVASNGDNSLFFGREQPTLTNPSIPLGEWGIQYWFGGTIANGGTGTGVGGLNFWKPSGSDIDISQGTHVGGFVNGYLFLADNGKVGIGCTNPQYSLDVNGTIRGKEVRVELAGCDFVFDKNYNLLSLKQRKEKVLSEKHLPNVASAFDMQKGQDLGVFTQGLLQNMEEHEQYLYQHQDDIEKLKETVKQQQQIIDEIKKQIVELKRNK